MALDPATLSPPIVEAEILRFVGLLERATQAVAKRGRASAEADADYRLAYAKAILDAEGTVQEREAQATVATQAEYRTRKIAEASLDAARDAGRSMREQLGALRSVNANLRPLVDHALGEG